MTTLCNLDIDERPHASVPEPPLSEPRVRTGGSSFDPDRLAAGVLAHALPIWQFGTVAGPLRALRPILVRVYSRGEFYFAENDAMCICGTGTSRAEAIADFRAHVRHFHKYYRDLDEERAAGEALRLKALFQTILAEE